MILRENVISKEAKDLLILFSEITENRSTGAAAEPSTN